MTIKWYNDQSARQVHAMMEYHLKNMVVSMFPNHELSHIGINRNDDTEEVIIKLHLNQIGRIKVVGGGADYNDNLRLPR